MSETGASPRRRILRYLGKVVRLLLLAAIYALIIWYGVTTTAHLNTPPIPARIAIALIALGITGSTYTILTKVADEAKGAIMVLAEFLNNNLLEPQKQRLRAQGHAVGHAQGHAVGHAQGRAEALAEVRSLLQEQGINPDDVILPDDTVADDADRS